MPRTIGLGAAALVALGTATLATGAAGVREQEGDVIVACQKRGNGFLRVVRDASACRATERVLRWNVRGPAGPPGPWRGRRSRAGGAGWATWAGGAAGAQGPAGPAGPAGAVGPVGPAGRSRSRGPAGAQGPPRTGLARRARRDGLHAGRRLRRNPGRRHQGGEPRRAPLHRWWRASASAAAQRGPRHQRGRLRPGRDGRERVRRAEERRLDRGDARRDRGRPRERWRRGEVRPGRAHGLARRGRVLVVPRRCRTGPRTGSR